MDEETMARETAAAAFRAAANALDIALFSQNMAMNHLLEKLVDAGVLPHAAASEVNALLADGMTAGATGMQAGVTKPFAEVMFRQARILEDHGSKWSLAGTRVDGSH